MGSEKGKKRGNDIRTQKKHGRRRGKTWPRR